MVLPLEQSVIEVALGATLGFSRDPVSGSACWCWEGWIPTCGLGDCWCGPGGVALVLPCWGLNASSATPHLRHMPLNLSGPSFPYSENREDDDGKPSSQGIWGAHSAKKILIGCPKFQIKLSFLYVSGNPASPETSILRVNPQEDPDQVRSVRSSVTLLSWPHRVCLGRPLSWDHSSGFHHLQAPGELQHTSLVILVLLGSAESSPQCREPISKGVRQEVNGRTQ